MKNYTILICVTIILVGGIVLKTFVFESDKRELPKQYFLHATLSIVEKYVGEIAMHKKQHLTISKEGGDYILLLRIPGRVINYKFRFYEKEGNRVVLILLSIDGTLNHQYCKEFETYLVDELNARIGNAFNY
ncbi:MAG: hypothetical protein ABIQ56_07760 [Chitinophagaceae bacterium]